MTLLELHRRLIETREADVEKLASGVPQNWEQYSGIRSRIKLLDELLDLFRERKPDEGTADGG